MNMTKEQRAALVDALQDAMSFQMAAQDELRGLRLFNGPAQRQALDTLTDRFNATANLYHALLREREGDDAEA